MVFTFTSAEMFPSYEFPLSIGLGPLEVHDYPMHRHEYAEVAIVLGGRGIHVIDDFAYPIEAGDVFVIVGDRTHGFRDLHDFDLANITYCPERLRLHEELLRRIPGYHALFTLEPVYRQRHQFQSRLRLTSAQLVEVSACVHHLADELRICATGYEASSMATFLHLLTMLSRWFTTTRRPISRALVQVAPLLTALDDHCSEPWTLLQLADMAHLSVSQLVVLFRRATGMTPVAYLIHRRIARSLDCLHDPQCSISEVAQRVGFTDSNYFSRQFKRVMGMSPRAYRQQDAAATERSYPVHAV